MMRRFEKFRALFLILSFLLVLGFRAEETRAQDGPAFSGPIFVLLYHPWEEGFESTFRSHLNWLMQNGYQTISPENLLLYLEGEAVSLPTKPILLTFDDGTIENYEIVYPMLEEFGYTGISFVLTDPDFTFYSKQFWWREVDRSGILSIENHSDSHGLVWVSPVILDFYSGENFGDYSLIKGLDSRLGAPIYEYSYELVNNRYIPDRRIANLCVRYVAQNGGKDFFKKEGWDEELLKVVEDFRNSHQDRGSYEKEVQKNLRFRTELYQSKKIIERTIGHRKQVEFFAYPWGAFNEELILELKKYGYHGAFTTVEAGNFPGDDPFKIKRMVITSEMPVEYLAYFLGD